MSSHKRKHGPFDEAKKADRLPDKAKECKSYAEEVESEVFKTTVQRLLEAGFQDKGDILHMLVLKLLAANGLAAVEQLVVLLRSVQLLKQLLQPMVSWNSDAAKIQAACLEWSEKLHGQRPSNEILQTLISTLVHMGYEDDFLNYALGLWQLAEWTERKVSNDVLHPQADLTLLKGIALYALASDWQGPLAEWLLQSQYHATIQTVILEHFPPRTEVLDCNNDPLPERRTLSSESVGLLRVLGLRVPPQPVTPYRFYVTFWDDSKQNYAKLNFADSANQCDSNPTHLWFDIKFEPEANVEDLRGCTPYVEVCATCTTSIVGPYPWNLMRGSPLSTEVQTTIWTSDGTPAVYLNSEGPLKKLPNPVAVTSYRGDTESTDEPNPFFEPPAEKLAEADSLEYHFNLCNRHGWLQVNLCELESEGNPQYSLVFTVPLGNHLEGDGIRTLSQAVDLLRELVAPQEIPLRAALSARATPTWA